MRHTSRFRTSWLLLAPGLLLLAVFLLAPIADLIGRSFTNEAGIFSQYERILSVPVYVQILIRTLLFSAATSLICLLIGYPVAYKLATARPLVKAVIIVCVLLPFWTNLLVRSYGWILILSPSGIINSALLSTGLASSPLSLVYNLTGVLVGMSQIMLPYMILPLYAVMTRIDPRVTNAARSLGSTPSHAFLKVYLPTTLPGVMAGTVLVFTISLGFFVVPALLGGASGTMWAQLIEFNINQSLNWGMASALSASLLVVTLALYWVGDRYFNLGAIWGVR